MASSKTTGSPETSRHQKDTTPVPSKKTSGWLHGPFQGESHKVSDILLSSWRKKTASQYESAEKAWSSWCSEPEINPFSSTSENILEF